MKSSTLDLVRDAIEVRTGRQARRSGKGFRLVCPLHGDTDPNLWIADGSDRLILSCKSHHCDPKDILESVGLSITDVFYEKFNKAQGQQYKKKVAARKLIEELSREMVIITLWISDYSEGVYPRNGMKDKARTLQSFQRVQSALKYFEPLIQSEQVNRVQINPSNSMSKKDSL